MLGGVATICGVCSYRWILSPAVARSWYCPNCGGGWGDRVAENACTCRHRYGDHHFRIEVPPSLSASGIAANELHRVTEIIAKVATIPPEIGRCTSCECDAYRFVDAPESRDTQARERPPTA